jgi:hypothetical protein
MTTECVALETEIVASEVGATLIEVVELAQQGPPGPPGDSRLPEPSTLADGRYITTLGGQYIDVAAPAGSGDMQTLIYDPRGVATDTFDLSNLTGNLDGGVFS